jgi:hypothetical protein
MKTINLTTIGLISSLSAILINLPSQALPKESHLIAQTEIETETPLTINQAIDQAFYQHSDDIFGVSTMGGFLKDYFGVTELIEGSYPENQIRRDAKLLNTIHQDLWKQQTQSTPTVRSEDLKNPYCTSFQTGVDKFCDQ